MLATNFSLSKITEGMYIATVSVFHFIFEFDVLDATNKLNTSWTHWLAQQPLQVFFLFSHVCQATFLN